MNHLFKSLSEPMQQKQATFEEQQRKVREVLGDLPREMPSFVSDTTIRRFLKARNWSTAQAGRCLKEAAKWRRQYQPEKIRWEDIVNSENEAKRAYIPDYQDKLGRTVFVTLPAEKGAVSEKEQIKYLVYILEKLVQNLKDVPEDNVVWICDFHGWTISSTPVSLTRESLHIIQKYYPGMIAVAIVTNPPRIFESFWKIIKHFLEPKMKEKVKFVYKNNSDSQKVLAEMFDLDKLESKFGGRNTTEFDIVKYAERMKTLDQITGSRQHDSATTSSAIN